ncbi:hypothetical protein [uncultured Dysgonomonas sp.]|uniref:Uncharacterized protein n=1 Tax=uncultured Dysgonomonas sp. TaxID=206096 RepID=A0A212JST2_9BACT|nr:hypothetical protein [uncultured Dysgonomonas sp.]SBW02510.1 conserved hypothetical protein [uncultured Dysgonomonas sp.]
MDGERTNGHRSETYVKVKSEELKVENEQEQVIEQMPVAQPSVALVEKAKVNLYPFLPPGYTSRTD